MRFGFASDLPIVDFLFKIDIPNLFRLCSYWQGARFMFRLCGITKNNTYVTEDIHLYQSLLHCTILDIEGLIIKELNSHSRLYGWQYEPLVKEMHVSYNI